jgi:hypothetical protein
MTRKGRIRDKHPRFATLPMRIRIKVKNIIKNNSKKISNRNLNFQPGKASGFRILKPYGTVLNPDSEPQPWLQLGRSESAFPNPKSRQTDPISQH